MSLNAGEARVLGMIASGVATKGTDFDGNLFNIFTELCSRGLIKPVYCLTDRAHELLSAYEDGRGKQHKK